VDEKELLEFVRHGDKIRQGCRVEAIREIDQRIKQGMQGTVHYVHEYGISSDAGVEWDENIGGHALDDDTAKDGHGWNVETKYLRKVL
jgi:hypothetical protein